MKADSGNQKQNVWITLKQTSNLETKRQTADLTVCTRTKRFGKLWENYYRYWLSMDTYRTKLTLENLIVVLNGGPTRKREFALGEICHLTKLSVKCPMLCTGTQAVQNNMTGKSYKAQEFVGKVNLVQSDTGMITLELSWLGDNITGTHSSTKLCLKTITCLAYIHQNRSENSTTKRRLLNDESLHLEEAATYNDENLAPYEACGIDKKPDLQSPSIWAPLQLDKDLGCYFSTNVFDEPPEQSRVNEPVSSATEINAQVVPSGTSLSTTITQDAPSTSASSTTSDIHPPVQHQEIAEEPLTKTPQSITIYQTLSFGNLKGTISHGSLVPKDNAMSLPLYAMRINADDQDSRRKYRLNTSQKSGCCAQNPLDAIPLKTTGFESYNSSELR
ncbi:hypothetical protein Tco_0965492 [Tanacetum coccineum]